MQNEVASHLSNDLMSTNQPFAVNVKKTYEMTEPGNLENRYCKVWISEPGSGLDKRQCTLQVCFRPTGKQLGLAAIFRGTGKRNTEAKKAAWDLNVDVYIQENAGADTAFSVDWVNRTLALAVNDTGRFALFCDNVFAQVI